ELYTKYAEPQPILDYHNHLSPKEIAQDRVFENITQLWIAGDHYKWRAMRGMGVEEKYITGDADDREKFMAWARTVPHTLRNPLYHWTHLELKRYFGIDELLNGESAARIYDEVNRQLQLPENSCRGLLKKMNVKALCTTEDPIDNLEYHGQLASSDTGLKMSTAFRPDKSILIGAEGFVSYIGELSEASGIEIDSFQKLCDALLARMEHFHENGCRLSDHGLNRMPYAQHTEAEVARIFTKRLEGSALDPVEEEKFQTALLLFLCGNYHRLGWVQQFHL